ncbi:flagellar hook-length control protein FliK [Rhizobium sp. FKL33]|uniref:flagellar hook-length control protein FliK n=1 Tax=Rhizobium sp. FKL33 TaxID=2562307 RepID=UPI0010C0B6A1|nr:flagellar hook-length control protein FliK [Rhizobium sp. FKL33]
MIDASATAVARGPVAVNGSKSSGSQDSADAPDDGSRFGDYLEEAGSEQANGAVATDDGLSSGATADGADGVRSQSIPTLFAIAQGIGNSGQQGQIDPSLYRLAQSEVGASKTGLDSGSDMLAELLSEADSMLSADQLAALASELQGAGDGADAANLQTLQDASLTEDGGVLASLFADVAVDGGEAASAAHRLLSSLAKALGAEKEGEAATDETSADTASEATTAASLLDLTQALPVTSAAQTTETPDATGRSADSVKDALAQVTATTTGNADGVTDATVEDVLKSAKGGEDVKLDGFDQVTVLDSRRYLGFGGDNAKALTAALANEASRALAPYTTMTDVSVQATATTVNTLKIQMNPEHLGTMTASLRLKGEELSVEVTVDTIEGYRHLARDQSAIVQSLRDQGFSVDQVSIQLNPAPKTESQQQDQGQYGSNQNLREGQGDAQRQQNGDGRGARSEQVSVSELQTSELDGNRGTGDSGDGGLYL